MFHICCAITRRQTSFDMGQRCLRTSQHSFAFVKLANMALGSYGACWLAPTPQELKQIECYTLDERTLAKTQNTYLHTSYQTYACPFSIPLV